MTIVKWVALPTPQPYLTTVINRSSQSSPKSWTWVPVTYCCFYSLYSVYCFRVGLGWGTGGYKIRWNFSRCHLCQGFNFFPSYFPRIRQWEVKEGTSFQGPHWLLDYHILLFKVTSSMLLILSSKAENLCRHWLWTITGCLNPDQTHSGDATQCPFCRSIQLGKGLR